MTTTIRTFSDDSFAALKRDHERLRYEVRKLRVMLRAAMSALESGKRPFIRFELSAALAKTDASKGATIVGQYGRGGKHATTITVYNPADATNGNYTYRGASGASGWAIYDPIELKYWIWDIDCPAA